CDPRHFALRPIAFRICEQRQPHKICVARLGSGRWTGGPPQRIAVARHLYARDRASKGTWRRNAILQNADACVGVEGERSATLIGGTLRTALGFRNATEARVVDPGAIVAVRK